MTETFKILKSLLEVNRSIRRFDNSRNISEDTLLRLVDLTRYCASGRNLQPLRYRMVYSTEECNAMFPALKWAGYYKDWDGPDEPERPVAYLIQCIDTRLTTNCLCDDGLHLETVTLGAVASGIGCCIIKSFNKELLLNVLNIDARYQPLYVLALGYPSETSRIVPVNASGDIVYYRNELDEQCVPKRPLTELLITPASSTHS